MIRNGAVEREGQRIERVLLRPPSQRHVRGRSDALPLRRTFWTWHQLPPIATSVVAAAR